MKKVLILFLILFCYEQIFHAYPVALLGKNRIIDNNPKKHLKLVFKKTNLLLTLQVIERWKFGKFEHNDLIDARLLEIAKNKFQYSKSDAKFVTSNNQTLWALVILSFCIYITHVYCCFNHVTLLKKFTNQCISVTCILSFFGSLFGIFLNTLKKHKAKDAKLIYKLALKLAKTGSAHV